jgi:branched-chain amino acid transport system permease protein
LLDIEILLQQLANGLVNGMGYVLIALGLTIVFGVMKVVNFAHGEFYVLGAYASFFVMQALGVSYLLSVPAAILIVAAVGIVANHLFFRPTRGQHEIVGLMSSVALSLILLNGVLFYFSGEPRTISSPYSNAVLNVGPVFLTEQRIIAMIAVTILIGGTWLFVTKTSLGKMMQATSQNIDGAALSGINADRVYLVTFALGCGLAGAAGALLGPLVTIYPTLGDWAVLKAFVVVIVGGLGSISGAIIAGIGLGLIEAISAGYLSSALQDVFGYAAIIAVLMFRPQGIFGRSAN